MEFLERDGLGVLLESLERLGARGLSSVADTFSQLQCVSCLRAVMNSQVGLEYIVQHQEYTRQLANSTYTHYLGFLFYFPYPACLPGPMACVLD